MTETGSQPPTRSHQTRSIAGDTWEWRVTDGADETEHGRCDEQPIPLELRTLGGHGEPPGNSAHREEEAHKPSQREDVAEKSPEADEDDHVAASSPS